MALTRSIRVKLAILTLLLAVAGLGETAWVQRTLGLDRYWKQESAKLELELVNAEATLAALRAERSPDDTRPGTDALDTEIDRVRRDVEALRRALAEARSNF